MPPLILPPSPAPSTHSLEDTEDHVKSPPPSPLGEAALSAADDWSKLEEGRKALVRITGKGWDILRRPNNPEGLGLQVSGDHDCICAVCQFMELSRLLDSCNTTGVQPIKDDYTPQAFEFDAYDLPERQPAPTPPLSSADSECGDRDEFLFETMPMTPGYVAPAVRWTAINTPEGQAVDSCRPWFNITPETFHNFHAENATVYMTWQDDDSESETNEHYYEFGEILAGECDEVESLGEASEKDAVDLVDLDDLVGEVEEVFDMVDVDEINEMEAEIKVSKGVSRLE